MTRRTAVGLLVMLMTAGVPVLAMAETIAFKLLSTYSRATFKSDAPLETFLGNTAGPGVAGTLTVDPVRPQGAAGTVRVDLDTVRTGVDKRDADMRGKDYLDTEAGEANRWAVFEIKSVETAGPLEPGKEMPAKVKGILTIKGKPIETVADARVIYVKLTPEQVEGQKRFGFTSDNIKVRAKFATTFTNHGMQIPQLLFLKVSNDILLETDLTFVRQ
ncbi:MAG: YceI family protein [candidate division NC10 bacterium]|nr:YceI family protein [candidate division NC10 bacterium]